MTATLEMPPVVAPPRLLAGRLLRGGNVHDRSTVFVQRLDAGVLATLQPADVGPDFAPRFAERFGQFPEQPRRSLVPLLLDAILAVERAAAVAMGRLDAPRFSAVVPAGAVVELVWSAHKAWISRAAAGIALTGLMELLPDAMRGAPAPHPDYATALAALRRRARRRRWSRAAAALAFAARRRGLSHELLAGNYVRLGDGAVQHVVSDASLSRAAGDRRRAADPRAVLQLVLPRRATARIPIALVVGDRGTHVVARRLERALRATRDGVGLAIREGTTIEGRPVDPTALGRRPIEYLLGDPRVRTAITATAPRRIAARGLGLDRVSVTAVLDPATGSDLTAYRAALTATRNATMGVVVISADNPCATVVVSDARPWRAILVTRDPTHPLARRHRANGGFVVHPAAHGAGASIVLQRGRRTLARLPLAARDVRIGGRAVMQALFTAGLIFGLDAVKWEDQP